MVKVKKLRPWAKLPVLGTDGAAAFDVEWCGENKGKFWLHIGHGDVITVGTGLAFELPADLAMLILPRSGLATKKQLRPANTPGLLDSDYRGELRIALENFGRDVQEIHTGDRIAQILFIPIERPLFELVEDLTPTDRGAGGFGSTGS